MVAFKRDYTVYLNNDNKSESEFTFRKGYSYMCDKIDGKIVVLSVDKSVRLELDEEDMKWIEKY